LCSHPCPELYVEYYHRVCQPKCMPFSSVPCDWRAHSRNIWRGTQVISLLLYIFLHHPVSSSVVFPHIPPSTLCALIPIIFLTSCSGLT
jgi:hypothetical protein